MPIICLALASAFGVQGWILKKIMDLEIRVALLAQAQSEMKKPSCTVPVAILFLAFVPLFFSGCAGGVENALALLASPPAIAAQAPGATLPLARLSVSFWH